MKKTDIVRGSDNIYSAYGKVNGRPFVAYGETLEEAQTCRQELKGEVMEKSGNVIFSQSRFRARPNNPFVPVRSEFIKISELHKNDQKEIELGQCPWCIGISLLKIGESTICPVCADEFIDL